VIRDRIRKGEGLGKYGRKIGKFGWKIQQKNLIYMIYVAIRGGMGKNYYHISNQYRPIKARRLPLDIFCYPRLPCDNFFIIQR
jgi:hypothetical protein